MEKLYSSDREICGYYQEPSLPDTRISLPGNREIDGFADLFDKNGQFIPRKLRESAQIQEDSYLSLSCSDYKEFRFLGLSGLLALENEKYDSLLWDAFYDSFYPIRALVIENLENSERTRLFNEIFKKLTGDPRQVIREKAYLRIKRDFSDLFAFRINNFSPEEQYRLIMFLDNHTSQDYKTLQHFIEGSDDSLSSRALYRIQKDGHTLNRWPERSRKLLLLRYPALSSFCNGGQNTFPDAFNLIDEHTPPGLASLYMGELIKNPFKGEWASLYEKMFALIGKMIGPRSRQLLELVFKNRDLKKNMTDFIPLSFSQTNRHYTGELLQKHLNDDSIPELHKALTRSAAEISLPKGV